MGNALEPVVFGKSLNMTPLSILGALVIWGSIWGIPGAILSVPLLGIQKICLDHSNHPMARPFPLPRPRAPSSPWTALNPPAPCPRDSHGAMQSS